jgi:hypothetical protein
VRGAGLVAFGGAAAAAVSLLLAAVSGGPYLTAGEVNGWIVVFGGAVGVALLAAPLVIERQLRRRRGAGERPSEDQSAPDGADRSPLDGEPADAPKERWEGASLLWGGISLCVLAASVPIGLAESFSGHSLAGTAALLATIESGLVLAMLAALLLAG